MTHHVDSMLQTSPNDLGTIDQQKLTECIEACFECAQSCTAWADACHRCEQACTESLATVG